MECDRRLLLGGVLASAGTALIAPALAQSAPPAGASVPLELVHPEYRAIVPQLEKYSASAPPMTRASLGALRNGPNPFSAKPRTDVPFERRSVRGAGGHEIPLYVVNAKPGTSRPAILHVHGGGYVMGTAESAVLDLQDICEKLDCVAVSVDYRLAPETTWRGSVDDNHAGLVWLHRNAAELGADPARIAVMGESAGGGHAALLAIAARDRGQVPLCFQCLVYPMLDDRTGSSVAAPPHVGTLIWTSESNRFGWESLLGSKPGGSRVPAAAVPARNPNLRGLPPAFIGVGSLDLFCGEDIAYAKRLLDAGVQAELIVVPGVFHGFDARFFPTKVGKWFNEAKLNALRRGFGMPAA